MNIFRPLQVSKTVRRYYGGIGGIGPQAKKHVGAGRSSNAVNVCAGRGMILGVPGLKSYPACEFPSLTLLRHARPRLDRPVDPSKRNWEGASRFVYKLAPQILIPALSNTADPYMNIFRPLLVSKTVRRYYGGIGGIGPQAKKHVGAGRRNDVENVCICH